MEVYLSGVTSGPVLKAYRLAGVQKIELDWSQACRQYGKGAAEFLTDLLDEGFKVGVYSGLRAALERDQNIRMSEVVDRYIEEVICHAERLDYFTDFDLHPLHSPQAIYNIREQLLSATPDEHFHKLLPLMAEPWNDENDSEYDVWPRIGLPWKKVDDLLAIIRRYQSGALFHGFSVSNLNESVRVPFKWISTNVAAYGAKYGAVFHYTGGLNFKRVCDTNLSEGKRSLVKRRLKDEVLAAGISYEEFFAESTEAVTHWNALQLLKFEKDLEFRSDAIEYWRPRTKTEVVESDVNLSLVQQSSAALTKEVDPPKPTFWKSDTEAFRRSCNNCSISKVCKFFKQDAKCSLDYAPEINNAQDVTRAHEALIGLQMQRIVLAAAEEASQGRVSDDLNELVDQTNRVLNSYNKGSRAGIKIEAEGEGVSILAQLFNRMKEPSPPQGGSTGKSRAARIQQSRQALLDEMQSTDDEILEAEFRTVEESDEGS